MGITIRQLPKKSQFIAYALEQFCRQHGVRYEFIAANGSGHPGIRVWFNGDSRKSSFSSTSSDFRAARNAVSQLRHRLIELGWVDKKEDIGMTPRNNTENVFKNQKESNGAASEVVTLDPKVVAGVRIPAKGKSTANERNEKMLQAKEAGAKAQEVWKAATAAGWDLSLNSITPIYVKAKNVRDGFAASTARKSKSSRSRTTVVRHSDDLALEIAEAIAPIIGRHIESKNSEVEELREQARKFRAAQELFGVSK